LRGGEVRASDRPKGETIRNTKKYDHMHEGAKKPIKTTHTLKSVSTGFRGGGEDPYLGSGGLYSIEAQVKGTVVLKTRENECGGGVKSHPREERGRLLLHKGEMWKKDIRVRVSKQKSLNCSDRGNLRGRARSSGREPGKLVKGDKTLIREKNGPLGGAGRAQSRSTRARGGTKKNRRRVRK